MTNKTTTRTAVRAVAAYADHGEPRVALPADVERATDFDWVPLHQMFADMRYARPLNARRVERMAGTFDMRAVGVLLLSLRPDGRYAIIDGNHRHAAAIARNNMGLEPKIERLPARIYIDLTPEDEAHLYRRFADVNKQTPYDLFKAGLAEGEPEARMIAAILHERSLAVSASSSDRGNVGAVAAIRNVYRRIGPNGLREIIGILHDAWGDTPQAYSALVLQGMELFWVRYGTMVDRRRLVERMKTVTPLDLVGKVNALKSVRQIKDTAGSWGEVLHTLYNKGLRNHALPEWKDRAYTPEARQRIVETTAETNRRSAGTEIASEKARRSWAARQTRGQG